jgi:hypothetical protein
MPITTINHDTPVTIPSTTSVTYSYLDLRKLVIRERAGVFTLRCVFLPSDGTDMLGDETSEHALELGIPDFGQFLKDREDTALKLAALAFIKELAVVAQEMPAVNPQP